MRILVATDNSAQTEKVLQFAARIVLPGDELPTVLTVVGQRDDTFTTLATIQAQVDDIFGGPDAQIPVQIRFGHPGEEIVREAAAGDYELVVMGRGSHRHLWRHLLHSSTTMHVVERSPCSVAVVQGEIGPIRRILLCDSGADMMTDAWSPDPEDSSLLHNDSVHPSARLGRFTAKLASQVPGEEEVTVLHVMSQISAGPGVRGVQLRADADDLIEQQTPEGALLVREVRALQRLGIRPNAKIRHGLVIDEILAETRSGDYDLVIIGAHQNQGWQRFLLDDLAQRLLVQLDRTVLIVK